MPALSVLLLPLKCISYTTNEVLKCSLSKECNRKLNVWSYILIDCFEVIEIDCFEVIEIDKSFYIPYNSSLSKSEEDVTLFSSSSEEDFSYK